ncbi:MAG: hypothetical protein JXQ26_00160 [Tissierellales bacterium]|nr:hypothetical protein [Tissierellales bacterium]MBN2826368.1 hypothetical protein [Tissierellales bacterium]
MVINKKCIFIVFMAFVLVNLPLVPVDATECESEIITPKFSYIRNFLNEFQISDTGKASVSSYLYAENADEVRVTGYLQQYKNGGWNNVKSWTESATGKNVTLGKDWYVESGYTYRYIAYGYIYVDGYVVESTSYVCDTVTY